MTSRVLEGPNLFEKVGMMAILLGMVEIVPEGLLPLETQEQREKAEHLRKLKERFNNANDDVSLGRTYSELVIGEGLWMIEYPEFDWRTDGQLQISDQTLA